MEAGLVERWLCGATIAPDGALIRYRDEQGRVHPWADRRGRWQPEYICNGCALVHHEDVTQLAVGSAPERDLGVVWQLAVRIVSLVSSGGHRSQWQTGAQGYSAPPCAAALWP